MNSQEEDQEDEGRPVNETHTKSGITRVSLADTTI